jgi:aldehyde:ferredoxin oxidoreductase
VAAGGYFGRALVVDVTDGTSGTLACPATSWLPDRLVNKPLSLPPGRIATLTADRLRAMIDAYYAIRGLDGDGRPDPAALRGLLLG